ncbi:hypothetical protein V496_01429 [Pseudogymnoascus sp. VKM F-4515 (FW-2607)]|nr:hypothetical protein V496_01429 [Pseudogymnoascus sp. VKM F-4515 (FW-2607)]KFY94373.1 hypothetical protein V498_03892 [Pseudogymnoascus sp. VKM F-4517 (FW-2822)]
MLYEKSSLHAHIIRHVLTDGVVSETFQHSICCEGTSTFVTDKTIAILARSCGPSLLLLEPSDAPSSDLGNLHPNGGATAAAQDELDVQTQSLYDAVVIGGLDEIFRLMASKVQDIAFTGVSPEGPRLKVLEAEGLQLKASDAWSMPSIDVRVTSQGGLMGEPLGNKR